MEQQPAGQRWRPAELAAVAALVVAAGLHQALLWGWEVEDAAISFAYARNLVRGLGPVHYAGAEPVEGFSNPSWVAILAGLQLVGAGPFLAARLAGLVSGSLAVIPAWALGRRLGGPATGLLSAGLLAGSSAHAIWGGSGLENPLFVLCLLAGSWALLARRDLAGGLAFALLGLTRPEGAMYGLLAVGWLLLVDRRRLLRWLPAWLLPLLAYQALRLAVFAWPLPNTYYAKRGSAGLWQRLEPGSAGVSYLVENLLQAPVGLLLPAALVGLWGRDLRLLLVLQLAAGAFFVAWSGGDWMKGARWISLLVPPLVVLAGLGLGRLARPWPRLRPLALVLAATLVVGWSASQVRDTVAYTDAPEQSPTGLKRRIAHYRELAQDLWLEDPTLLDIDMGAATMWSGMRIVDYGRLLDVPMAHHRYRPSLLREHLLSWHQVDLAHLHGKWERRTGIVRLPEWRQAMVEVEGYPLSRPPDRRHQGIWVRREHLVPPQWQHSSAELAELPALAPGLVLVGSRVHGQAQASDQHFLLDLVLARTAAGVAEPLVELRLVDSRGQPRQRWTVLAGRAWYPVQRWERGASVRTRVALRLPEALEPGRYELELALGDGPAQAAGSIQVLAQERVEALQGQVLAELVHQAEQGECEVAVEGWQRLRLELAPQGRRSQEVRSELAPALGACFRDRFSSAGDEPQPGDLVAAAAWQPGDPHTRRLVRRWTRRWMDQAAALAAEDRPYEAFQLYGQVLRADPTRTWARRRREELRPLLP